MDPEVFGYGDVVISNQVKMYAPNKIGSISTDAADDPFYHFAKTTPPAKVKGQKIKVDDRDRIQEYSYHRYQRNFVECPFVDGALGSLENLLKDESLNQLDISSVPEKFKEFASIKRQRQVQYGWIFGSDYVVDSKEYRTYINEKDEDLNADIYSQLNERDKVQWKNGKLLALDMESYGALKAVETLRTTPSKEGGIQNLVGGIIVRGISDMAEAKGQSDRGSKNELRRVAVHNAAEITAQIIEKLDYSTIVEC